MNNVILIIALSLLGVCIYNPDVLIAFFCLVGYCAIRALISGEDNSKSKY